MRHRYWPKYSQVLRSCGYSPCLGSGLLQGRKLFPRKHSGSRPAPVPRLQDRHSAPIRTGVRWFRLYPSRYPDPLRFGYSASRFSDPRTDLPEPDRFGVVYFFSSLIVCFLERVLSDRRNGRGGDLPIPYAELEQLTFVERMAVWPLNLDSRAWSPGSGRSKRRRNVEIRGQNRLGC